MVIHTLYVGTFKSALFTLTLTLSVSLYLSFPPFYATSASLNLEWCTLLGQEQGFLCSKSAGRVPVQQPFQQGHRPRRVLILRSTLACLSAHTACPGMLILGLLSLRLLS